MKIDYLLFIFSILLFLSCQKSKDKKEWESTVVSTVNKWHNKEMSLPDSLSMIDFQNDTTMFLLSNLKKKYRFVVYIDAECSVCLMHFRFWEQFVSEVKKNNCDYLFYVCKRFTKNAVIRNTGFTLPYIIDDETLFISENELWDKRFQCALLNDRNEVVIIGDPTLNVKLKEYYINTLRGNE